MRLTLVTVALVSWLGISGLSDPLWNLLESFWPPSGSYEKAGAGADPDGVAAPEGGGADPDGLTGAAPAGAGADPNG
jgi:hypothetical protein